VNAAVNDDKSPLIDLIRCVVCNETMKLDKAPPTPKEGTSFNIGAACATELSGCDYSAEVEIRWPEAKANDACYPRCNIPIG
jgi:hypothetical protein